MHSALYSGWVRHHRRQPKPHRFTYPLTLFYIDLDELATLEREVALHTEKRWRPLQFRREDYLQPPEKPLKVAACDLVEKRLHFRPQGAVRLLTAPRMLGLCFNPVSFYYCFDENDQLVAIIADINNTPWDERYAYVLPVKQAAKSHRFQMAKDFHVSPFMPMTIDYDWRFGVPDQKLWVHMENHQNAGKIFSATLVLKREAMTPKAARRAVWKLPAQGYRVVAGIYWQALKLWLKRIPFYDHPQHTQKVEETIT